jgi:uncharacterized protein YcbK (DUF882 family)
MGNLIRVWPMVPIELSGAWMGFLNRMRLKAVVAVAALSVVAGTARASDADVTSLMNTSLLGSAHVYHLRLHHLHTGESIDVVYKVGNMYIPTALSQLNHFLRDHRTDTVSEYDPREFDLLQTLMTKLGRPNGVIDIVCGYRTPWSNAYLRRAGAESGVAEHSQHMAAKAIDIRVPGVTTAKLRDTALSLDAGGVGYYPRSQFVHVDVGPVREWSFGATQRRGHARLRTAKYTKHRAHGRSVIRHYGN